MIGSREIRQGSNTMGCPMALAIINSVRTTRKTGGLHKPYKGIVLAAPQGAVKRSADRIGLRAAPPSGAAFIVKGKPWALPVVFLSQ